MRASDLYDREEDEIIEQMNSGEITQEEGRRALRNLQREAQAQAEEAAREAYDRTLEQW